jgi:hypothetical protein
MDRKGVGDGRGDKSYDRKKAWSSINHSLFSVQADISYSTGWSRDTGEGLPLLTVETEAKGDLWSADETGPSLAGFVGLVEPLQEIFILPWLLWSAPVQNIFFLTAHGFN